MLQLEDVNSVDVDGLWRAYQRWSAASRRALSQKLELPEISNPELIVLGGMGGSGTACDIVHDWLSENCDIPSMVVKDFHLPKSAGRKSLVFAVSLSGDTGETLSILFEARKRECALVAVSSGGELETRSKKLGIPFNRVERLLVPRASLPGMALVPFRIMQELGIVRAPRDMKDIAVSLSKTFTEVSPRTDLESNPAKKLARKLWKRRPVIYSSSKYASAAHHFKASMNENAKTPVSVDYFPELFHNEVETWLPGGKRAVVVLRHQGEDLEIQRKLAKAESILAQKGIPVTEVRQDGEMLTSLLNWCLFLDMVSVYVSVLNGRAPLQTPMIDIIKSGSR